MSERAPRVSVIVVNYRGAEDTVTCLRALRDELDWPADRLELICVDNASGDGSAEQIAAAVPHARLVRSATNIGFAGNLDQWSPKESSRTRRARAGTSSSGNTSAHSASTSATADKPRCLTRKRISSPAGREDLHRQQMLRGCGRHPQPGVVEHPRSGSVTARRDINAGLLVEPPLRQAEFPGDRSGLIQDYTMRLKDSIDIASRPTGVVSQRHRRATEDVEIPTTPRRANRSPSRRKASSMAARSSSGSSALTRPPTPGPPRTLPAAGTRQARGPTHLPARPGY